jgi:calmodulin
MSSDIGFEEAERRRLAFAGRHGRRGGGGGRQSVFASHGEEGRKYMVKLAREKLEADALNRTVTSLAESSRVATLRASRWLERSASHRRTVLALAAYAPVLQRGCSLVVWAQLALHEGEAAGEAGRGRTLWGWAALGIGLLAAAGLVEGVVAGRLQRARDKATPEPEMTRDAMGKPVPRTMHDCHCPLSVVVQLPAARDLTAMDFGGTSDPYVRVKLLGRKTLRKGKFKWVVLDQRKTKTVDKSLNPEWGATFEFANPRRFGSGWLKLVFEVYDADDLGADDLIGECSLPDLSFLEEGDGSYDDWEQLFAEDGDEAGELCVHISAKFTEEDSIRGAFERLDADGSGELERPEIAELMTQLGRGPLSEKALDALMAELDADGSGEVDFEEFYAWFSRPPLRPPWPWGATLAAGATSGGVALALRAYRRREELLGAMERAGQERFDAIDEDGSGELDRSELGQLAQAMGKKLGEQELTELMEQVDADGSGLVDYQEFFDWYMEGVDNSGLDRGAQALLYERAPDVAPLALLTLGVETVPQLLLQLYVALTLNSFDHIDLFQSDEGDTDVDALASVLSITVTASVAVGLLSATVGWLAAEQRAFPAFAPASAHGLWTALWRASELGARLLTLAAFGCAWRGWTFLLLLLDLLIISQLNLCERMSSGATLERPDGAHIGAGAQLFFGAISTLTYVGSPSDGLSCLCRRGAIVGAPRYYALRAVELGLMVLAWQLGADGLAAVDSAETSAYSRTCYDQVYLLGSALAFTLLCCVAAPQAFRTDPRRRLSARPQPPEGRAPIVMDAHPSSSSSQQPRSRTMGSDVEVEELFGKSAWESDSGEEEEGARAGAAPVMASAAAATRRHHHHHRGGAGQQPPSGRGHRPPPPGLNDTVSSVGWEPWDTAAQPPHASHLGPRYSHDGDGPASSASSSRLRRGVGAPSAADAAAPEGGEEAEAEEYAPLTQASLDGIQSFQRAIVKVMSDASVPRAHKTRRIAQLVAARNRREAEATRAHAAAVRTRSVMQGWGGAQLREALLSVGLAPCAESRAQSVRRLLEAKFEVPEEEALAEERARREAQAAEARRARQEAEQRRAERLRLERQQSAAELQAAQAMARQQQQQQHGGSDGGGGAIANAGGGAMGPAQRVGRMRRASLSMVVPDQAEAPAWQTKVQIGDKM